MDQHLQTSFVQWDSQEAKRLAREASDQAYIALNNLYLQVQRGRVRLTITIANDLRVLAGQAYQHGDPMLDWWAGEFIRLPRWNDV
jgi:hypothetical protein